MGSNKKQILGFIILLATLFGCQREEKEPDPIQAQTEKRAYPHEDSTATGAIWQHIKDNYRFAQDTEAFYGVPACISLAQAILESGGGTSNLGQYNNFFGHRSFPNDEKHYYTGKNIKLENGQLWRVYDTPQEAYEHHGAFYVNTRVWDEQTKKFKHPYLHLVRQGYREWLKGLNGYAGDRQYGQRLKQVIVRYNLVAYNLIDK
jgi:flagellum-specific peptidoglycan hydrolase FlgJ